MSADETGNHSSSQATAKAQGGPLIRLISRLPLILSSAGHQEMWGVDLLETPDHAPTTVILQKFLRANNGDAEAAEKQLVSALKWRKEMRPLDLAKKTFDRSKFDNLGYVTVHKDSDGKETVVTWNIYGLVKSYQNTFGNIKEFIQWRTALMELSVQKMNLNAITTPIPSGPDAVDPYQMLQVHDYKSVSFFRVDPSVKAASKETITTFSMAYPELLREKYFVNVPAIMGWMYGLVKLFVAPATLRKFHPMNNGANLAGELGGKTGLGGSLPREYGGDGPTVRDGLTVALEDTKDKKQEQQLKTVDVAVDQTKLEDTKLALESENTKPAETFDTETTDVKNDDADLGEKLDKVKLTGGENSHQHVIEDESKVAA